MRLLSWRWPAQRPSHKRRCTTIRGARRPNIRGRLRPVPLACNAIQTTSGSIDRLGAFAGARIYQSSVRMSCRLNELATEPSRPGGCDNRGAVSFRPHHDIVIVGSARHIERPCVRSNAPLFLVRCQPMEHECWALAADSPTPIRGMTRECDR